MLRNFNPETFPFIISLIGVIADYLTTIVGLGLGYYETHPQYHPFSALMIFWSALAFLKFTLPAKKIWRISKNMLASVSFLGAVNNTLVILGVFPGLVI